MIREKAKDLLTKLKQGYGSATLFGSSYYDEETLQIIEIIANECKAKVIDKDGKSINYESDTYIQDIKDIIKQLLSDKNTIKNSLVSKLTSIPGRNIAGFMKPVEVHKKINENGIPYIEVEKPFPENITEIITGQVNQEELMRMVIKPYIATICKRDERLSKRHFFSKIFNPLNRREITNVELMQRIKEYLSKNTDLDEEKINNTAQYYAYNILGNKDIIQEIIDDEIQGKSLQVVGGKQRIGYNGMIQNMSNNLLDILNTIPNPNSGLGEVESIYANLVGQLEALSIDVGKTPEEIEEQIKIINRNINRSREEHYDDSGYRNVNVGFGNKDVGLLRKQYVPQAMQLYSEKIMELLEHIQQMSDEQYIKEVTKLHFRFIQIHPFPDGNGRTARAISNMLLLEKGMSAVFRKESKSEYLGDMKVFRGIVDEEYIKALYTDHSICDNLENERDYHKLEEYIGMQCLDKPELYADRNITAELPVLSEVGEDERE